MKTKILLFLILFIFVKGLFAAEWQWSVEIKSMKSDETNDHPRAFLWIPSDCKQVRGIVVGMHNMQEEGIMEHPDFRKTMSEIGFAEIWVTPGIDPLFDTATGAQAAFDEMLESLAEVSGYTKIKYAPIVPVGHSAYASFPWNFAAWNPERTLAILSVHGDAPKTNLTGCGRPNLDWQNRNTNGIPGLMVMGEYEWWEDRLDPAIIYKKNYPEAPVSLLADAGHGHFDHSDMLIEYLALFIRKAAKFRLPETIPNDRPIKLKPIDPQKGWLADRWHPDQERRADTAPYPEYKGDRHDAFWYFDQEIATLTERYYEKARGKKAQYIGIVQDGILLPFGEKSHANYNVRFKPEQDGLIFHLAAIFTDSLRSSVAENHSKKENIKIDRICGPVQKINDTTFTVCFYRMGLNNPKRTGDIWLIAHHEGDKEYKSSVQQLNIRIPYPIKEGKAQNILFNPIDNISKNSKEVTLEAKSDSGLPVCYYVKEGPAEIIKDKLIITKIPPRAKYPVKVTVVAWQYGIEGKYKTAEAVERSFYIRKNRYKVKMKQNGRGYETM
ncbi:hypothetical protein GGR21_000085 [Dysgonomonas hofstadii]|uniref:Uncharacterized protein n=1 Tax=Dysgonomonas hofstadii TaxID=637886 RepID=A0A840CE43_9BACT|nr:hypothetical protein [Dysgonomonas hofstadii]MBB4034200.1 hypothetical protein [Dysgonomonas hofstadii]